MEPLEYDHLFKINLIGDAGVGKTKALRSFCEEDLFADSYVQTTSVDFRVKTINLNQKTIKLQIWDNPGSDRYLYSCRGSRISYRGSHGILIFFDVTDQASWSNVKQWLQEIDRYACENVNKVIVACKCELLTKRVVDFATANNFAEGLGIKFVECSPKYGINIDEVFTTITLEILGRVYGDPPLKPTQSSTVVQKKPKKEKGCASKIQ